MQEARELRLNAFFVNDRRSFRNGIIDNLKTLKISYNFKQLCRLLDEIQYCFHFLHPFAPKTVSLIVKDIGYKKSKLKHVSVENINRTYAQAISTCA